MKLLRTLVETARSLPQLFWALLPVPDEILGVLPTFKGEYASTVTNGIVSEVENKALRQIVNRLKK